jgi:outer membrane protein assembly factor BamB
MRGCPWCGATGRTAWGTCPACGHYYLAKGWETAANRKPTVRRWIIIGLSLIALLGVWLSAVFLPNPLTLVFKRPSTQVSSNSRGKQWAMWGRELQQRRYVAEVPQPLAGRLVWSVDLGSPTRSVPVLADNVIYLGGHFQLLALDAHTGHRLWEVPTTGPVHMSPTVAGNLLYIGLQDWRLLALERQTGTTRWAFTMQGPVAGAAAVAGGIVYIGSLDGVLYALDAATGRRLWEFKTEEQPLSPPALADGTLFVASTEGSLYALHAKTGKTRLRYRTPERLHDAPVVANGLVYFPSGGQIYAVAAEAREFPGQYQLKLVWAQLWIWQFPVPRPPGQPGGRWRFSPRSRPGWIVSAPAVAPEALYVGDTLGSLYARDALTGTELWQFQAAAAIMASPVIVGSSLYFGANDGVLYALDRAQGALLWTLSLGAPIQASPVFANDRLYVRSSDGRLHAIE